MVVVEDRDEGGAKGILAANNHARSMRLPMATIIRMEGVVNTIAHRQIRPCQLVSNT